MSRAEMGEMVLILDREDYDGRRSHITNVNAHKSQVLDMVIERLHGKFGVLRTKDQLRKRWSDLKLREEETLNKLRRKNKRSK